ncbi:MAG: FAD-dependent oxidoreductase [Vicinamibacterales bacterium]
MGRSITRRDFLDGARVALTGSVAYPWFADAAAAFAQSAAAGSYPPARTGLRGTHDGAWEVAHALRDGRTWEGAGIADTGETYDLVVVGGGISGLAAAYFYRKAAGPGARILVLDNHDDFGGHAKRNEFTVGSRLLIGYGGTQAIEQRRSWSPVARGLSDELGIDTDRFFTAVDQTLYSRHGLGQGVFFDREAWGVDRLVRGGQGNQAEGPVPPDGWWRQFAAQAPFSAAAKRDFVRLHEERVDYLAGRSIDEKRQLLRTTSYRDYLLRYAKVDPQVAAYFQQRTHSGWGIGIDAAPATAAGRTWPGLQGLGLPVPPSATPPDPYIFHFPDGNASIARLLVRRMIPGVSPAGTTMDDIVTARFDYGRLDEARSPVRIRLSSTVVRAQHEGDPSSATRVAVTYVTGGKAFRVSAGACVLACYHAVIPRLCPELPAPQRQALMFGVKAPLVYTNVLLRDWKAFEKAGISHLYTPSGFHALAFLDFPVTLGSYRPSLTPAEPILLHMVRVPCAPGRPRRDQHRAGRADLLQTPFETFERRTRDQLARAFAAAGFDPARDILGITVNRWPHGYADFGDPLTDPEWSDAERPWVIARQRFGRIGIANSDAAHEAETHAAIDEGHRAVQELLALRP